MNDKDTKLIFEAYKLLTEADIIMISSSLSVEPILNMIETEFGPVDSVMWDNLSEQLPAITVSLKAHGNAYPVLNFWNFTDQFGGIEKASGTGTEGGGEQVMASGWTLISLSDTGRNIARAKKFKREYFLEEDALFYVRHPIEEVVQKIKDYWPELEREFPGTDMTNDPGKSSPDGGGEGPILPEPPDRGAGHSSL